MKPRPFYRWKSFWLGLCVLVFLGWAWARSREVGNGVTVFWSFGERTGLLNSDGRVSLSWGSHSFSLATAVLDFQRYELIGDADWFPAVFDYFLNEENDGYVGVAHWFLILLFLVPWTSFLVWRVRKQGNQNA